MQTDIPQLKKVILRRFIPPPPVKLSQGKAKPICLEPEWRRIPEWPRMVSITTPLRQPPRAKHLTSGYPANTSRRHHTECRWQTGINPQNPANIINNPRFTYHLLWDNTETLVSLVRQVKDLTPHLILLQVNTITVPPMVKPRSTRITEVVWVHMWLTKGIVAWCWRVFLVCFVFCKTRKRQFPFWEQKKDSPFLSAAGGIFWRIRKGNKTTLLKIVLCVACSC